ncbi:MAG: hypothetical protein R2867_10905 [Caldilineaceae bacterium]
MRQHPANWLPTHPGVVAAPEPGVKGATVTTLRSMGVDGQTLALFAR